MGKFIVIEGMDGSGKSTITKLLANELNAISYKTPPDNFSNIRPMVESCHDQYAKLFYYLSGNYFAAEEIKKILNAGRSVICDRYYYTTLSAYDELLCSTPKLFSSEEKLINTLYQPDFTFFLTISEDERIERIKQREDATQDDIESMIQSVSKRQIAKYSTMNMTTIDTNGLDQHEVVSKIIQEIYLCD